MSQEDTLRPRPDGSEDSHCGRGFEGGLGVADLCPGCWTCSRCRSRAPGGQGWEVSGPGCGTTVLRTPKACPLWP